MLFPIVQRRDAAHLGRLQRLFRKGHRIFVVLDDVDLLTPKFTNDGLHPHAFHADAGAHCVHVFVLGHDCDLGPLARFTGDGPNAHRAAVWPGQRGEDLDGGGLARAVRAEQPVNDAARDADVQPVQRPDAVLAAAHGVGLD